MSPIIVPIAGAGDACRAAGRAIDSYRREPGPVHLLAVQHRLPRHVSRFLGRHDLDAFYHDEGMLALEPAMRLLDDAGIAHEEHVLCGRMAETIVYFSERYHGSRIILDEHQGVLSAFTLGSIGNQVRHLMRAGATHAASPDTSHPTP